MGKPSLHALRPSELALRLGGTGRARAVWAALREGHDPFVPATLGHRAAARLAEACESVPMRRVASERADCGTTKLALEVRGGDRIETVLVPQNGRTTVCVSSQLGCARACVFCVTASMGLVRSLDAGEIVGQVSAAIDAARDGSLPAVRNVVFMGMGEPLDNLEDVRRAIAVLTDPHALGLGPGHVTLSTVGTDPATIRSLGDLRIRIAWSLHAADDAVRRRLVPTARHAVAELRDAFADVLDATEALLFVEVTLVSGVNDGEDAAAAMARFLEPLRERVRVNLLPMNPGRSTHRPASAEGAARFRERLRASGSFCLVRKARGADRNAACGQLATGASRSLHPSST